MHHYEQMCQMRVDEFITDGMTCLNCKDCTPHPFPHCYNSNWMAGKHPLDEPPCKGRFYTRRNQTCC